ncbi:CRISPR-associated RAMP family protein [Flavonifractor sp. An92]|nr:CRISPR-associated RAMP family protein [Flavonifractor sp. An92]
MDDVQSYFRAIADAKKSVAGPLKTYYRTALGLEKADKSAKTSFEVPNHVHAGYLYRDKRSYYIRPIRTFYRISRSHPDVQKFGNRDARVVPVSYQLSGEKVARIGGEGEFSKRGLLLYTGRPVAKQPNALYLFPAEDPRERALLVPPQDVMSYTVDWEKRRNVLRPAAFWALPKGREHKPVFYVRHEGHLYFGCSRFLRIGYRYPLSRGLPQRHREQGALRLDYPSAVLGFARGQATYRSRVSFGDFRLEGKARELPLVKTVLGEPKPSFYAGYVEKGKHYNEEDFRLRGYKQYWLKEAEATPLAEGKDRVGSTLRPLDRGSVFRGTIRYKNLTADELGLLLWAIRLDEGCFQTLGMGKPYGYGRMQVTISALREVEPEALYTPDGLCGSLKKSGADAVEGYIRAYHTYASQKLAGQDEERRPIQEQGEILDFFFLKRTIREGREVSYLDLNGKEYQNLSAPLPSVAQMRRSDAEGEEAASSDALAALLAKYGRKF